MHLRSNVERKFRFAPVSTHAFWTNVAIELPSRQERATRGPNFTHWITRRKLRIFSAGDQQIPEVFDSSVKW